MSDHKAKRLEKEVRERERVGSGAHVGFSETVWVGPAQLESVTNGNVIKYRLRFLLLQLLMKWH